MKMYVEVSLIVFFYATAGCGGTCPLTVDTTSGPYHGKYEDVTTYPLPGNRRTTVFYGIRYGSATRFESSTLAEYHPTPQNATEPSKACYQVDMTGVLPTLVYGNMEESCLTLNVYVPGDLATNNKKKAVMLWVHPGGLQHEAAFKYNGTQIALNGDVIVVTIQYRLGIFGYYNIRGSDSVSNNGLRDILTACKWVQENIGKFGGDKNSVTLFGQSGGSIAISMLVASPLSAGLFHRAIAMSGGLETIGVRTCCSVAYDSLSTAVGMNCSHTNPDETLQCMQSLTPEQVIESQQGGFWGLWENRFDLPFIGCYGDDFLPEHPKTIYKNGRQNPVELVMGVTNHDGVFSMPFTFWTQAVTESQLLYEVTKITNALYPDDPSAAANAVINFYNNSGNYPESDPQRLEKMLLDIQTDRMITGIYDVLSHHSKTQKNSYFYDANYSWLPRVKNYITGRHGEDLSAVFGQFLVEGSAEYKAKTKAVVDLVHVVQKAWTNFGKTGDPNPLGAANNVIWPRFANLGDYSGTYMELSKDETEGMATPNVKNRLRSKSVMKFWLTDMHAYNKYGEN